MRKLFDYILTINLLVILGVLGYLWWSGQLQVRLQSEPETGEVANTEVEAAVFAQTLRDEVDRELGQPVNGYEPQMFLRVFPGIAATDFEDVEASIGKYVVVEGQLVHVTPPNRAVHSAAGAVTNRGLQTLLSNIQSRTGIDLAAVGTVTDIMTVISAE